MVSSQELLIWGLVFLTLVSYVTSSAGDRSFVFNKCMQACIGQNCTGKAAVARFVHNQPFMESLFRWSCSDECGYICMWRTVDAYQRDHSKIPQFYGKWPFIRLWGMQEPASVVFSLLNGLSNVVMMVSMQRRLPAKAPMYWVWQLSALVAINAWVWSTIFHTRDTLFTEAMDYISATGGITFTVIMLCARILLYEPMWKLLLCLSVIVAGFSYHVYYLMFVHFDYGYNMKAMAGVAAVNSIGWYLWCMYYGRKQPYVWKAALTIFSLNLLLSLELGDFAPFFWTFDAHSLWHLGTVPCPLLWFSFAIDDSLYLYHREEKKKKIQVEDLVETVEEKQSEEKKVV